MATAFEEVIGIRGVSAGFRRHNPAITGSDPVFSTRSKIGETCAAVLGGVGVRARLRFQGWNSISLPASRPSPSLKSPASSQRYPTHPPSARGGRPLHRRSSRPR
jgi:hypothetical protein